MNTGQNVRPINMYLEASLLKLDYTRYPFRHR